MTVPYTFANQAGPIPLAELDANFAAISSFGQIFNPTSSPYNAVGNGIADDTAALQSCANAAAAAGGTMIIPAGYTFSITQLYIKKGTAKLIGFGGTLSLQNFSNAGVILQGENTGGATGSNVQNCEVYGLQINTNGILYSNTTIGIWLDNSGNCSVHHNWIYNCYAGFGILARSGPICTTSFSNLSLCDNVVQGRAMNNAGALTDPNPWWGIGCYATDVYYNANYPNYTYSGYAQELWVRTFTTPTCVQAPAKCTISRNNVNGGYYGLYLHHLVDSTVEGNKTYFNVRGISLQANAYNNTVTQNVIRDNYSAGIHLAYGSSGNTVEANVVITSVGVGEALLNCYVGCSNNKFTGNRISNVQGSTGQHYLIYCGVHAVGNVFDGNTLSGDYAFAAIGCESAWTSAASGWPNIGGENPSGNAIPYHYAIGVTPTPSTAVDNFASQPTSDNVFKGNTIFCNTAVSGNPPSLYAAQIQTIATPAWTDTGTCTASCTTNVLTVTGSPTGVLAVGQNVVSTNGVSTIIVSLGSGTGGAGTYNVTPGTTNFGSQTCRFAAGGCATLGYSAPLVGNVWENNTCILDGGSPNQLYLYEWTDGNLYGGRLVGNTWALPSASESNSLLALGATSPGGYALASTYFQLPRGRAHFLKVEGDSWFNSRSTASVFEFAGGSSVLPLNLASEAINIVVTSSGQLLLTCSFDDNTNCRGACYGQKVSLRCSNNASLYSQNANQGLYLAMPGGGTNAPGYAIGDSNITYAAYNNATAYSTVGTGQTGVTYGVNQFYSTAHYYLIQNNGGTITGIPPGNALFWRQSLDSNCFIEFVLRGGVCFETSRTAGY